MWKISTQSSDMFETPFKSQAIWLACLCFSRGDGGRLCLPGKKVNTFGGEKSARTNQFTTHRLLFSSHFLLIMLYLGYLSVQATGAFTKHWILWRGWHTLFFQLGSRDAVNKDEWAVVWALNCQSVLVHKSFVHTSGGCVCVGPNPERMHRG